MIENPFQISEEDYGYLRYSSNVLWKLSYKFIMTALNAFSYRNTVTFPALHFASK